MISGGNQIEHLPYRALIHIHAVRQLQVVQGSMLSFGGFRERGRHRPRLPKFAVSESSHPLIRFFPENPITFRQPTMLASLPRIAHMEVKGGGIIPSRVPVIHPAPLRSAYRNFFR